MSGARDPASMMRRALRLAARARGRTAPNPLVGAVLARDGRIVGEGYHHRAGEAHAEANALAAAGPAAAGADLYVTLEPCAHHGHTPPCVDAVLAAGIRAVTAAMRDPNPHVEGGGLERLGAAGIPVSAGLLEAAARELNAPYLKFITQGMPYVTLKVAMTLDGKIAAASGDSRWVTGERARRYAHRLRDWNDAVLIGNGTARADDPLLTARLPRARNPLRVILDTQASLSPDSQIARTAREVPTLLVCSEGAPAERCGQLEGRGVELLRSRAQDGRVLLGELLRELAKRNIMSLLVEGGAEVAASFLDEELVDRVEFLIAPKIIGGRTAPGAVGGAGRALMAEALRLRNTRLRRLGEDWLIQADVHRDR